MTDVFLNALQLNNSTINVNIPTYSVKKKFNNAVHELYQGIHAFTFPVSAGSETYSFELVIWRKGGIGAYTDLLAVENLIYNEINNQVVMFNPVKFRTSDTQIYLDYLGVYLLFESAKFTSRASDGLNFISLTFDGLVWGPVTDDSANAGVTGSMVADYMVGA